MHPTAQLYFKSGILLLITGVGFGIFMSASHDHTGAGAHAHLNLLGFVVSSVYGAYFALFPAKADGLLPKIIWGAHTLGICVMFPSLVALLYGNLAMEPLVAGSSIVVFVAMLLFAFVVWKPVRATAAAPMRAVAAE
jgi:hypothetical protein